MPQDELPADSHAADGMIKRSLVRSWGLKKYLPPILKGWLRNLNCQFKFRHHAQKYGRNAEQELQKILRVHERRRGIVIFFSTCDWHYPHFQRPHQLARALSDQQFLVFYITQNFYDRVYGLQKIKEGLYLASSPYFLSALSNPVTILDYAPFIRFIKILGCSAIVYDFSDALEVHERMYGKRYRRAHHRLLQYADLVTVTSDDLAKQAVGKARHTTMVPNGVDVAHFSRTPPRCPPDLEPILRRGKTLVGYYGAFDWVDFELLKFMATHDQTIDLVLIGADFHHEYRAHRLDTFGNVSFLGAKNYQLLPAYSSRFDVAIIPFRTGVVAQVTSPIKLYEYLAAGLPVVATEMHECQKYRGVWIARSYAEFLDQIHAAVQWKKNPHNTEALRTDSSHHSWNIRATSIVDALKLNHRVTNTTRH